MKGACVPCTGAGVFTGIFPGVDGDGTFVG
jgi:hypothetical protein